MKASAEMLLFSLITLNFSLALAADKCIGIFYLNRIVNEDTHHLPHFHGFALEADGTRIPVRNLEHPFSETHEHAQKKLGYTVAHEQFWLRNNKRILIVGNGMDGIALKFPGQRVKLMDGIFGDVDLSAMPENFQTALTDFKHRNHDHLVSESLLNNRQSSLSYDVILVPDLIKDLNRSQQYRALKQIYRLLDGSESAARISVPRRDVEALVTWINREIGGGQSITQVIRDASFYYAEDEAVIVMMKWRSTEKSKRFFELEAKAHADSILD